MSRNAVKELGELASLFADEYEKLLLENELQRLGRQIKELRKAME